MWFGMLRMYSTVRVLICIVFVYICIQSHVFAYPGCTNVLANNYDMLATTNDGSCIQCSAGQIFLPPYACCNDTNNDGTCDFNEVCNYPLGHGCTDSQACNYDPSATIDVGSCVVCTSWNTCVPDAIDPTRTSCCEDPDGNGICWRQNGWSSTVIPTATTIEWCTASNACNYNANATSNDNSCIFPKCNGWCPWDSEPEPFRDNCNVCDADPSNDDLCLVDIPETTVDCLGEEDGPALPWTSCDDEDETTENDLYTSSCSCEWFPVETQLDCENIPWGEALPWTSCNDGNSATIQDTYTNSCSCEWIPVWTLDCAWVVDGPALPWTSCNDNNSSTVNDRYDVSCDCIGQAQQLDCNNILWWVALPWTACNDSNPATSNDRYSASCSCVWELQWPDCRNVLWGNALPWTSCDDNNAQTYNDRYTSTCVCEWVENWTMDCNNVINGLALPW